MSGIITNPGGAAQITTSNAYMGLYNLLLKRSVDDVLWDKYPDNGIVRLFDILGQRGEIGNTSHEWAEDDWVMQTFGAAGGVSAAVGAATQTITIAAADHYNSGALSFVREGEVIQYPNSNVQGYVRTKNTTVAGAHTIVVAPKVTSTGAVVASLPAVTAGDRFIIVGAGFAEGSAGTTALTPLPFQFRTQTTITKENHTSTGTAQNVAVWFQMDGSYRYTIKGEKDAIKRHNYKVGVQVLTSELGQTTDGSGRTVTFTEGIIPALRSRGNFSPAALFDLDALKNMFRALDRNKAGNEFVGACGFDFHAAFTDVILDTMRFDQFNYDFIGGNKRAAIFSFEAFQYTGSKIALMKLDELNEPNTLGSDSHTYKNACVIMPLDYKSSSSMDAKRSVSMVEILNLKNRGFKLAYTGMNAPTPTNDIDELAMHTIEEYMVKVKQANRAGLFI